MAPPAEMSSAGEQARTSSTGAAATTSSEEDVSMIFSTVAEVVITYTAGCASTN